MLNIKSINFWAVLVAWIAAMVVGSLWYGPFFGKSRMQAAGAVEGEGTSGLAMGVMTVGYLVQTIIVAHFINGLQATTAAKGLAVPVVLGVFLAITQLINVLFENRPMSLFWINGLYAPVEFGVIGVILGAWQRKKNKVVRLNSFK